MSDRNFEKRPEIDYKFTQGCQACHIFVQGVCMLHRTVIVI